MKKRQLVFVASSPRSGSTLLANVLGNSENIWCVGEALNIHSYLNGGRIGNAFNGECACGSKLLDCEIWGPVLTNVIKKLNTDLSSFHTSRNPYRRIGIDVLLRQRFCVDEWMRFAQRDEGYAQVGNHLFSVVEETANLVGCDTIVDSSKTPATLIAYLARNNPSWTIKVIHLIRDPRATAFSMRKGRVRANVEQMSFYRCLAGWSIFNNTLFDLKRYVGESNYSIISHEMFCRDPQNVIANLARFLGLDINPGGILKAPSLRHDIGGSFSMKDNQKSLELRNDDSWKLKMNLPKNLQYFLFAKKTYQKFSILTDTAPS